MEKKYNKKVSEIMRAIRFDLQLDQKDLGEKLGLKQSHISRIENDKSDVPFNKLQKWCDILNVSLIQYL